MGSGIFSIQFVLPKANQERILWNLSRKGVCWLNSENLIVLRKKDSHLIEDSVSNAVCFEVGDELFHVFFLFFLGYLLCLKYIPSIVRCQVLSEKFFYFFLVQISCQKFFLLLPHQRGGRPADIHASLYLSIPYIYTYLHRGVFLFCLGMCSLLWKRAGGPKIVSTIYIKCNT